MRRWLLVLVAAMLVAWAQGGRRVDACVLESRDASFVLRNGPQRGIVMWDNGYQELVLMPGYAVGPGKEANPEVGADGGVKGFRKLGWLVPVPASPDAYREAATTIFKDLHEFTRVRPRLAELKTEDGPVVSEEDPDEEGMKFLEAVNIGDYAIQPIKAGGDQGARELEAWLKDKGFPEVGPGVLRWYVAQKWCWLAVSLNSDKDLAESGDVKPLQISFKTPRPVFPLKINDGRGEFDAEIWVIVRERIDLAKTRGWGLHTAEQQDDYYVQENRETGYARLPASVQEVCREREELKALRLGTIFCYRFSGKGMEGVGGQDVATWLEDLHFALEKDSVAKPAQEAKPAPPEEAPQERDK